MFGWFRKKINPPPAPVQQLPVEPVQPLPVEPFRRQRCSLNAPGDFYTTEQCLACEAPEAEAPELLASLGDGNFTTYFVRQPKTPEEVERACCAVEVCCVSDLRYGGTDRTVIERLGNDPLVCDYVILDGQLVRSDYAPDVTPN
jgi:hypothetical protein